MWRLLQKTCFDHKDAFFQPHTELGYYLAEGASTEIAQWFAGLPRDGSVKRKDIVDWYFPADDPALASFRVRRESTGGTTMWIVIACLAASRYQRVMVRLRAEATFGPDVLESISAVAGASPIVRIEKARDIVFLTPFRARCHGAVMSDYASVAVDHIGAVDFNGAQVAVPQRDIIEFEYAGTGAAQGRQAAKAFTDWATAGGIAIREKTKRKFDEFAA